MNQIESIATVYENPKLEIWEMYLIGRHLVYKVKEREMIPVHSLRMRWRIAYMKRILCIIYHTNILKLDKINC